MDNSNVGAAPWLFLRIFYEVTYCIRTVGNSTLLKINTLPNHTITIGVCISILETQLLGLLYGRGASFVQKCSMPWMSANIKVPFLYSLIFYAPFEILAAKRHKIIEIRYRSLACLYFFL
jgi:hypothetical protein